MGASVARFWLLLSKEFVVLVAIANLIMWPAVYFGVNSWLQAYAYQAGISILPFLIVGGSSFMIVLLTIGLQSYKAATSDPVNAIRSQ